MYDAYFEDLPLIAPHRMCEVRFDELEAEPVEQLRKIYGHLSLEGYEALEPALVQYTQTTRGYQKNDFPRLDEVSRRLVAERWRRSFKLWGYAL